MTSKVIAVFGATGAQCGSVLRALAGPGFHVRGLTRDPNSEKAKNLLKYQNVEVVRANLDDRESLDNALKGRSVDYWTFCKRSSDDLIFMACSQRCPWSVLGYGSDYGK
jgi:nucleoside-diphosphate-sugar epimerase